MAEIHVCSLALMPGTVARVDARSLLSLVGAGMKVERPDTVPQAQHLNLAVSDIAAPMLGYVVPDEGHVRRLLEFLFLWDQRKPLVVHCFAGVSRSTAAAFIAACTLAPNANEMALAEHIRELSPTATPNPRLVALADDMLDREGRMVAAIASIGRGRECYEGVPFAMELKDWQI